MNARLVVKNFGPIVHVDLALKNVNVFIGPQASGKSTLAKLYTICNAPGKFLKNGASGHFNAFKASLEEYNIQSYLKEDSEVWFESDLHKFGLKQSVVTYRGLLKEQVEKLARYRDDKTAFEWNTTIREEVKNLYLQYDSASYAAFVKVQTEDEKFNTYLDIIRKMEDLEAYLSNTSPLYIASERNFINILKNASFNLLLNNVPIPKHLLLLGAEMEKSDVNELDLGFLQQGLVYRNINGEDKIFTDNQNGIKLTEAAAGIQSIVPLLLPILSGKGGQLTRSFVIEEPELNLFPSAQYGLLKLMEAGRKEAWKNDTGAVHLYTTHSPYILAAFNNLLYASKVWNERGNPASPLYRKERYDPNMEQRLREIIPANANVQPSVFSAYQINEGYATSILDNESGLISDNFIDNVSDEMTDDFEALMELMK